MTGPLERLSRLGGGRILLLANCGLAVTAVAALTVGTDDARLLRLGIVAALWAALLGAFATIRTRREVDSGAERTEELRMVYRLELEREVAARREHELTVERELRDQLEQREHRDHADIIALRGELQTLRETLQHLLGGDVLVERVALRAESTRLRPLPDARAAAGDAGRGPAAEVSRAPYNLTISPWATRPPSSVEPGPGIGVDTARRDAPALDTPQQRPRDVPPPAAPAASARFGGRGARPAPDSRATPAGDEGGLDRRWSPAVGGPPAAWEQAVASSPESSPEQVSRQGRRRHAEPDPPQPGWSAESADRRTYPDPDPPATRPGSARGRHGRASEPSWQSSGATGRHTPAAQGSNGSSSLAAGSNGVGSHSVGSHSVGSHSATGRSGHSAEERRGTAETGAHSGGRSVDDLLAAYREDSPTRRHRRRTDN